ncbi:Zn-dependent exopeptidase [Trametes gibbosa]|nr:Zn-dependent exopeptidase [Trametes gibbosa]
MSPRVSVRATLLVQDYAQCIVDSWGQYRCGTASVDGDISNDSAKPRIPLPVTAREDDIGIMVLVNAFTAAALIIAIPHHSRIAETRLSQYYYGTHGQNDVFITDDSLCVAERSADFITTGTFGSINTDVQQLVWLQQVAVDPSIKPQTPVDEIHSFLSHLPAVAGSSTAAGSGQIIIGERGTARLIHRTEDAALISVDASPLPSTPVPFIPVPSKAVERVKGIPSNLTFDPVVVSRHSFSKGGLVAAEWLKDTFGSLGASCELKPYLSGFAPNVICTFEASEDTTETVLISAHYDSRGSFGSVRAPGGDDDGSDTTALLGIARTIARKGVQFRKNVQICAFSGEEQGLYGSRYYAQELREKGANLTLMVQADMLAYHAPGEPPQLSPFNLIGTPEPTETGTLSRFLRRQFDESQRDPVTDHTPHRVRPQSCHLQGFHSTHLFERAGLLADFMYHNSGDLSDRKNYDFVQLKSLAKVQSATLLHVAGYDLASDE